MAGGTPRGALEMSETTSRGLEGIVIADSSIGYIDGQQGVLRYRGISIEDLANHSTYEETAYLLLFGDLPTQEQLETFTRKLAAERELDDSVWDMLT
jgi:citrate synthase